MKKSIYIGTSGYAYRHWLGIFYPEDLAPNKWLEFYSRHFNAVELNITFYRLPSRKIFMGWYKRTPKSFKFVIKGSRFITHIKKLNGCGKPLKIFFDNACALKEKLLCTLWQLPPSLRFDLKKIKAFVALLKRRYPFCLHSFEFRNESWFKEETYNLLKENNINLCLADSPNFPICETITSSFLYLRFHGGKILYGSQYQKEELNVWAEKIRLWFGEKKTVFAFFNNDFGGFAVKNALELKRILNEKL
jgi:uncharacterized protein YecE (DUF72 family)